jgi:hypothetical protein
VTQPTTLATIAFILCSIMCAGRALSDDAPNSIPTAAPVPVETTAPPHSRSPFAIAVGVAFPSSTNTTNAAFPANTGTQFAFGLQYGFSAQPAGMVFAYLDLRSVITYGAGAVGLGYSTESLSRERPYVGAGLSYTYAYAPGGFCPPPHCIDTFGGGSSTSGVGGKAFAGIDVAPGLGIEASYNFSPPVHAVNTDAIGLALKYRF